MKLFLLTLIVVLSGYCTFAQQPVHWKFSSKKLDDKTYELHITATIDDGWHIYAQKQPEDAIAQPTSIKFKNNPLIVFNGTTNEVGKMEKHKIEALGIEQYQYSQAVDFVQKVKLINSVKADVSGSVIFQVCTDEMCLPPKEEAFSLSF